MKNNRNATRQLLGVDRITDCALSTPMGDLAFFIVKPTNIGVLPESSRLIPMTTRSRSSHSQKVAFAAMFSG